jgi:hypothetical protein
MNLLVAAMVKRESKDLNPPQNVQNICFFERKAVCVVERCARNYAKTTAILTAVEHRCE